MEGGRVGVVTYELRASTKRIVNDSYCQIDMTFDLHMLYSLAHINPRLEGRVW